MRTPEQRLWDKVRPVLRQAGHAMRVENPLDPGTPDVSFAIIINNWRNITLEELGGRLRGKLARKDRITIEGWLELKVLPAWPKNPSSIARVHVRPAQRLWWEARSKAGGFVAVLLWTQATDEYTLFDGMIAAERLGRTLQAELKRDEGVIWWHGGCLPLLAALVKMGSKPW